MDARELERIFGERAERFREDYHRFLWGALVLSAAIVAGVGVAYFLAVSFLLGYRSRVPGGAIVVSYFIAFTVVGYLQYRRRLAAEDESNPVLSVLGALYFVFAFPGLVFYFISEMLAGRRLFSVPEVDALAREILAEGGEKPSAEFLQEKLARGPEAYRRAMRLLLEMELLRSIKKGRERILVRTEEAEAMLREAEKEVEERGLILPGTEKQAMTGGEPAGGPGRDDGGDSQESRNGGIQEAEEEESKKE